MLGLSAAQIRSFATKGFLQPERGPRGELRFGFHDLVILRTAGELGVPVEIAAGRGKLRELGGRKAPQQLLHSRGQ